MKNTPFVFVVEATIKANAQQTRGNYEINSGSSGGLISLQAKEVSSKVSFQLIGDV